MRQLIVRFDGSAGRWVTDSVAVLSLVMLAGCSSQTPTLAPQPLAPECRPVAGLVRPGDSLSVALLEPVEPKHAPLPHNGSEELLFAHLYEPLASVDCLGNVRAVLADSWWTNDDGRSWTIRLKESATFWDGSAVTSADVVMSWQAAPSFSKIADSVVAIGPRTARVYLTRSAPDLPHVLTTLTFSLIRPSMVSSWPMGTGPYRLAGSQESSLRRWRYTVQPTGSSVGNPILSFVESSTEDARDLLADGVDLMITADPSVIEYASRSLRLDAIPLSWEMTYVLLSVSRAADYSLTGESQLQPLASLRDGLAADAVRVDARGFQPPLWWDGVEQCDIVTGESSDSPTETDRQALASLARDAERTILFPEGDAVARDVAERVVSIAGMEPSSSGEAVEIAAAVPGIAGPGRLVAEGVSEEEFEDNLARGAAFLYVMPITRRLPDPCGSFAEMLDRVPWLKPLGRDFSKAFVPLLDTRRHAVAVKNRVGLFVDWFGNVRVASGVIERR